MAERLDETVVELVNEEDLSTNESGDEENSDFYDSDGEDEDEEQLTRAEKLDKWIPLPLKKAPRELLIVSKPAIDSHKTKPISYPTTCPLPKKVKVRVGNYFLCPRGVFLVDLEPFFDRFHPQNRSDFLHLYGKLLT